ncbi:MAG: cation diffusion facilitator family transporter [Myxococcota bacterium]
MGHGHDHDHDHHHHGPGHVHVHVKPGADPRMALAWALGLNGLFLFVELGVGLWSGSLALLSDAAHMLSDVAALALALGAAQLARTRPSSTMTYGLGRAEILGAFSNGILLVVACGWITWEAVSRLLGAPPDVPGWPVLIVGIIGLLINLGSAAALWRTDKDNLNVRAALAHMLADALGSVGAIIAAGLLFLNISSADAWISLVIAIIVMWGAVRILKDSGRVLLELPPTRVKVADVRDALLALDGVIALHDLHVWTVDGATPLVSVHLVVTATEGVTERAHEALLAFGAEHSTLQLETDGTDCAQADCGESAVAS